MPSIVTTIGIVFAFVGPGAAEELAITFQLAESSEEYVHDTVSSLAASGIVNARW